VPSARTSAGNEEYEYKKEQEFAVNAQQASKRRGTVLCEVAVAVALRHAIDRNPCFWGLSTNFVKFFPNGRRFAHLDVQMSRWLQHSELSVGCQKPERQ
jgi:hypothetical protein